LRSKPKHRPVPEEIPDAEHELVIERVCAIDVAKASGTVCVRTPRERRRVSKVWDVEATTGAVTDLADQLTELGVEKVTVESTSDYWRIWYYLLEAAGLDVQLVNARDVKNVPGRPKTDKLDAVWLAKLTEKGCCGPRSCRPRRSGSCATTPGCGSISPGNAPGTGSGWKSFSKTRSSNCPRWRPRWTRCRHGT
jgi:transposase